MFTAERQRAQPYLDKVTDQLIEQWYLLHHRIVRIVTNHRKLANEVRHFLYYAEFLAENMYENATDLPIAIHEALLWQVGERLYRPIALTCYLFLTQPGEAFPPAPAEEKPNEVEWETIPGMENPMQARWKNEWQRSREYQSYPGVSSRISAVRDKKDLHATIFVQDVERVAPWFMMGMRLYMLERLLLTVQVYS